MTVSSGLGLVCMQYARVGVLVVGAFLGSILGGIFFAQYGAMLQPRKTSPSEMHPQELMDSGIGFKGL